MGWVCHGKAPLMPSADFDVISVDWIYDALGPRHRRRSQAAVLLGAALVFVAVPATPKARKPQSPPPDQLVIGRRTFFDFGPPFEFYEIFSIHPTENNGVSVERIQVAPPGDVCTSAASFEVAAVSIDGSIGDLLGGTNPCTIPVKDLRRELKRCKRCPVFSGEDIVMRVRCGGEARRIRMDILDRDMFDHHPVTPEHTSWTITLLSRLDKLLGSAVMERPLFTLSEVSPPSKPQPSPLLKDLEEGKFDGLFDRGSYRPSELFRQAQIPPASPTVEVTSISPFRPTVYEAPRYTPLARAAHVDGQVALALMVKSDGHTESTSFLRGNPILQKAVALSVSQWVFPAEAAGQEIHVVIEFKMNCQSSPRYLPNP
jgi:Gram-negative bacterial TonB protein C-terminal